MPWDDRPRQGPAPPAVIYRYAEDRRKRRGGGIGPRRVIACYAAAA